MLSNRPVPEEIINDPNALTVDHVQDIGRAYIELYGDSTQSLQGFFISFSHNHQPQAVKLRDCDANLCARELWNLLTDVYATLHANSSSLAKTIFEYFKVAFAQKIVIEQTYPLHDICVANSPIVVFVEKTTKKIADDLRIAINHYLFETLKEEMMNGKGK